MIWFGLGLGAALAFAAILSYFLLVRALLADSSGYDGELPKRPPFALLLRNRILLRWDTTRRIARG